MKLENLKPNEAIIVTASTQEQLDRIRVKINKMNIKIKDRNNNSIELGDKVQILKITDDSGNATDLYGVEPQLNGWVDIVYIESFEGVITYDEEKLMIVIKGERRSLPLSNYIRYNIWNETFDRVSKDDLKEIVEDYDLPNDEYETIIDYLVKL